MLPHFLVIGAMKAGTTTLYRDLGLQDGISLPAAKEPGDLLSDGVLSRAGRSRYESLWSGARRGDRCGEFTTTYSARESHPQVARRARAVLGPDLKIIYVLREPIARTVSHFRYFAAHGRCSRDFRLACTQVPGLVARSRYAWQLEPWLDQFPAEQVLLLQFERAMADRKETLMRILRFLNVPAIDPCLPQLEVQNATDQARRIPAALQPLLRSDFYRRRLRTMLPDVLRDRLRRSLPTAETGSLPTLTAMDHNWLREQLFDDVVALGEMPGLGSGLWHEWCEIQGETGG